jgi:hypothetical protein
LWRWRFAKHTEPPHLDARSYMRSQAALAALREAGSFHRQLVLDAEALALTVIERVQRQGSVLQVALGINLRLADYALVVGLPSFSLHMSSPHTTCQP